MCNYKPFQNRVNYCELHPSVDRRNLDRNNNIKFIKYIIRKISLSTCYHIISVIHINNENTSINFNNIFPHEIRSEYVTLINKILNELSTTGKSYLINFFVNAILQKYSYNDFNNNTALKFSVKNIANFKINFDNWINLRKGVIHREDLSKNINQLIKIIYVHYNIYKRNNPQINQNITEKNEILRISNNADFFWILNNKLINNIQKPSQNQNTNQNIKRNTLTLNKNRNSSSEIILGLDFGTSFTKIVAFHNDTLKCYATEFKINNQSTYFLPSALYEVNKKFFLNPQNNINKYNNLKLNFLNDPNNILNQTKVVAFLALAIKEAKIYLIKNYNSAIGATNIVWGLNAGYAGKDIGNLSTANLYKKLVYIAWHFSCNENLINESNILIELNSTKDIISDDDLYNYSKKSIEIEISVQPEITAQIYAFVSSSKYDPRAANHYLIVDVGAGTVDTAIFNVQQNKNTAAWDFTIFKDTVERHGVVELERNRINWWDKQLKLANANNELCEKLKIYANHIDQLEVHPESYKNYFIGIDIPKILDISSNPDNFFYEKKVLDQVKIKTLYKCYQANQLETQHIENIPFFLCGGGSRMGIYKELIKSLQIKMPGFSWLRAKNKNLEKPDNLISPNLNSNDYDRLSVAYGLSKMYFGKLKQPIELTQYVYHRNYRDNYIDASQT